MKTIGFTIVIVALGSALLAQGTKKPAVPRTPDGRPDLQGNWTNATITPLERLRPETPLNITEEDRKSVV